MSITSETLYRAECDHPGCGRTLPDGEEFTHWPREVVVEALAEERDEHDDTWTVVGDQTYCPEHAPGTTPCGACEHGYIRADCPAGVEPHYFQLVDCPVCDGRGYLTPAATGRSAS